MKDFFQKYLPWILVVILLIILIFFRSCSCSAPFINSESTDQEKGDKEKNKHTGNSKFDSLKVNKIIKTSGSPVTKISFPEKINLNAVNGFMAGLRLVAGSKGKIFVTPNGGLNWLSGKNSNTEDLYGVAILSRKVMIAVGNKGIILRSKDGGLNWSPVTSNTTKNIKAVSFADENTGYAAGDDGLILKTEDGGITWKDKSFTQPKQINSICFINSSTGWFAGKGGIICKTTNGGTAWDTTKPSNENLTGISFSSTQKGTAVGENGTILFTTNGGVSWAAKNITAKNLKGVHRVDNSLSFIVGAGTIIRENNGVYLNITTDSTKTYNAVDPESPYVSAMIVTSLGDIFEANTNTCDDCNLSQKGNHDVVFLPPLNNENPNWKVRIRIYSDDNFAFKRFLKVITPGLVLDQGVISGWTQHDNSNNQYALETDEVSNNPRMKYLKLFSSNSNTSENQENQEDQPETDAAIIDMIDRQAGFIELSMTPAANNTFNNGKVEFYFGEINRNTSDTNYCYRVTYILGQNQ